MKKATVAVFLLLSVLMAFGRNVTDQEVATALKRALRARDNLSDTAEVQVSSALATGKDICIEYRASTAAGQSVSGLAVYRTEDELVFLDNSWIWERACLSGKYGQRRNGKDLTHALNAFLAAPVPVKPAPVVAVAAPASTSPTVPPPVVVASAPVQPISPAPPAPLVAAVPSVVARAVAAPDVTVQRPAVPNPAQVPAPAPAPAPAPIPAPQVAAKVAPAAPAVIAVPAPTPVAAAVVPPPVPSPTPAPVQVVATATPSAQAAALAVSKPAAIVTAKPVVMASMSVPPPAPKPAPVVASVPAASDPPAVATVAQPAPIGRESIVAQSNFAARNPAASTETTLHGVTIIDNNGALGSPTSTVSSAGPVESLADVARRVRGQRTMQ
jgi:hypothetical protein